MTKTLSSAAIATVCLLFAGCASVLNTAGESEFSCPGLPNGVLCKTPAAVYKSTHGELPVSDFDTAIGAPAIASSLPSTVNDVPLPVHPGDGATKTPMQPSTAMMAIQGAGGFMAARKGDPRPVREPAKIVRIWIAPWIDRDDNLHLAQLQYTEVAPRTWTIGKDEIKSGSGYVIPHIAFTEIPVPNSDKPVPKPVPVPKK